MRDIGLPGGLLARVRREAGLRHDPRARARASSRSRGRDLGQERQGVVVEAAGEPLRVLPDGGRPPPLLRHRERHRLRDAHATTAASSGSSRRRCGQGRAGAERGHALLRHLRRPRLCDQAAQRQAALACRDERRQLRPRRGQLLRHPGDRLRARVHRQHRRQHVLVLGCQRQARLAAQDRLLRVRLRGGRPGPRRASRPSTSAPTTARSTRSTPVPAARAGRSATAARSPARRPSSATSSTTPTGVIGTRARCGSRAASGRGRASAERSTPWCPTARRST